MTPDEAANVTAQLAQTQAALNDAEERAYYWREHAATYKAQRDASARATPRVGLADARAALGL